MSGVRISQAQEWNVEWNKKEIQGKWKILSIWVQKVMHGFFWSYFCNVLHSFSVDINHGMVIPNLLCPGVGFFFSFVVVFLILPPTTSKYEKIWEAVILMSVFILLPFLRWIVSFAFMPQELVWFHNGGVLDVCTWASPFASDEVLFHSVSLHSCTKLYWKVNLALYKAHFNGEDFCKSFSSFPLLLELSSGSLGLFSKGNSFLRQLCNYGVIL